MTWMCVYVYVKLWIKTDHGIILIYIEFYYSLSNAFPFPLESSSVRHINMFSWFAASLPFLYLYTDLNT